MFIMIGGFVMADSCFVGICLYIVALYNELKYMMREVDANRIPGHTTRDIQLKKCVRFHGDILKYT